MTSFKIRMATTLSIVSLCCAASLPAQDTGSSASADKTFLMNADEGNSAEIAASELALRKSKNPDVKAYAQKMITDHQKLRSDMSTFTQQMGVTTPQPLSATHKAEDKHLAALSGKSFDAEYVKSMDQDHHKTLGMFQNEVATTSNQDLKAAVQQGTPVIQEHTDMADQLAGKMNVPTASTPSN